MEDELIRTDVTFRTLLDQAPDHIMIVDRDHRLSFVNRLEFGFEMADVLGRPVEDFVAPAQRDRVEAEIDAVIRTSERRSYETAVNTPKGDFVFSTRAGPIVVGDQVDGVVLISTDITERLEAERERDRLNAQLQQSQKMEALGQLTGGVAHDFNNLLSAIGGNLELLGDEFAPGSSGLARLAEARRAVEQAADLTQRLLVFARNHPLVAKAEQVDVLIEEMAPLLERTLGETVDVQVVNEDRLWPCKVDRGQLEQALLNLAVNARDALRTGGILEITSKNVIIETDPAEQLPSGDYVSIRVRDTGIGMAPEIMSQALEPFFTTKDPGRGTGLGLSMVYGFASQSGGRVTLSSQPGHGTTVEILLPRSDEAASQPAEHEQHQAIRRGSGEAVLVVEDQPMVREVCRLVLEKLGYRTREAKDATEALAALEEFDDFALVLTDFGLPGDINGVELARRVAKLDPKLPVVLMSGYADPEATGGNSLDGIRFLQKPFLQTDLAEAVADALR
jgi:PAS domain S-box-containing protein